MFTDKYEHDPEDDDYYNFEPHPDDFEPDFDYYADEYEIERENEVARVIISEINTIDEALTLVGVNPHYLNNYFYEFDDYLRNDERLATMAVNADGHNIKHINSNTSFYERLAESAVKNNPYVFNYLPNDVKERRQDLKEIYDDWQLKRDAEINDELPFSKTSSDQIQGYYDAKNDKVVVIANNVSANEASKVAIHEVAHRGMVRMAKDLGGTKELNQILLNAENELMKALPQLLKRTGHKNVEELVKDYGFDINTEEGKIKLLNELAARWAETLVDKPKPSWWREFITSIKKWITKFTGKTLNEQEVNELVGGFVKYGTQNINNKVSNAQQQSQPTQQSNSRIITTTKKESLVSAEKDEKGNDIEETLTGYMNAIVDMVKNPEVINQSNLNLYTASTAFLLARAGVDRDWTTVFLKQPILVDLVKQMNISESRISQKIKGTDGETLKALDVILKKYGSTKSGREFKEDVLNGYNKESKVDNLRDENGFITITEGELRKEFDNPNNKTQLKVLKQFLEYQTKGFSLADLMTVMSADTDGATKNGTTADMRNNLMMDVIANNEFTNLSSLLGYDLDANNNPVFNDTRYIGTYHKNSVQLLQKIAKQKFISSSDSFKHAVNTIARYSGHKKLKTKNDEDLVKNIENELFAGFIEEAKIVSFNDIEDLKTLLYGNKSKISKILEQKEKDLRELAAYKKQEGSQLTANDVNYFNKVYDDQIKSLPKTKTLAERVLDAQIEHPDNLFLSALLPTENVYNNGKPSTVSLSSKNIDKESKDDLYLYWEDLLNIDKQLAEDLIKYSYYSSGFSPNLGVFFEHIPTSWVIENKLNNYIKNKLTTLNESNMGLLHLKDQVVRHSYKNNSIVPTVSDKMLAEFKMSDGGIVPSLYYAVIQDFNASNLEIGENKHGQKEYKTFIKRIYTEPNTQETFTYLYQYKGYGLNKNSESKEVKHLLYERVSPLGTTKGINIIKEYGNNGESIFPENKVNIPPYYKDYIDKLKLIEPLPIEILHDSFDKKDNIIEEPNENDLMYCNIKIK
jgi:hypothetical protein